ncbi:MAG: helix-turn-helix domain-containing protein [Schwartzia sp.]|nr:helix-turn-helix domain-containing protein [Schwartzia sp. (in: firmicutes)]
MPEKDTQSMEHELSAAEDFDDFWAENGENFRERTLAEHLRALLTEKGMSQAEVIRRSCLEPKYANHIFAGRKKRPSRAKVLSLALAMELSPREAQYLLGYAGVGRLYVRNPWDSVLWYALERRMTVMETNALLEKLAKAPLLGRVE